VTSHNTAEATKAVVDSFSLTQTVPPANQPPTVSLTSPANGATYTAPANVAVAASASDPENRLARVDFFSGTTKIGSAAAAPFSMTWSGVAAGTYAVSAEAFDLDGGTAQSATSTITVNASGIPTGISFQASADHATLVTSYRLDIYASGANPATATPVASMSLGKPTPDATGTITVDESAFFAALATGSYQATVIAMGSAGSSQSAPVAFTR
jgi:hypothetical protein